MAIARSNRMRLVYTAVTVAASAVVIGSGGPVSAASHAANVGHPNPSGPRTPAHGRRTTTTSRIPAPRPGHLSTRRRS
jgi:hypothetical protein